MSDSDEIILKDNFYFFENVHIKVEDTQYCVPKVALNRPGSTFADMFTLPNNDGEGSREDHPIVLPVRNSDFRSFLRVLFNITGPGLPKTLPEWIAVVDLATMWGFVEVRARAIEVISRTLENNPTAIPPLQQITLGRKYKVAAWVEAGYSSLINANQPFDYKGLLAYGLELETICELLKIRETILTQQAAVIEKMVTITSQKRCSECKKAPARWTTNKYQHHLTGYVFCDTCHDRQNERRPAAEEDMPGFSYTELFEGEGPALIATAFKDEFVQLDKAAEELSA